MTLRRLQEQRVDNGSSNDDLKRSINTLPTSSPQNPAPNPFIDRKPTQSGGNEKPADNGNGSTKSQD